MKEMHMIKQFLDYLPCLKEMKIFYMEKKGRRTQLKVVPEVIVEMVEHYVQQVIEFQRPACSEWLIV